VASNIADEGRYTRDIMAVTGHRKEATVAGYTKQADRRRRAKKAIDLLERM
jgi:hypothetical protein